jgi:acetoin:2,6-dichlorophenolindophenol oxidoreductase subunit beta
LRGEVTDSPVELGVASVARPGRDVLLIATQLMVHRGLAAARDLAAEGVEVEVIDLRTLYPLDLDTVVAAAARIGRVLIAHEAPLMFGFGGEIAASISEACWGKLAAPVRRLGAERSPIPYSPVLEDAIVPSQSHLTNALRELARA